MEYFEILAVIREISFNDNYFQVFVIYNLGIICTPTINVIYFSKSFATITQHKLIYRKKQHNLINISCALNLLRFVSIFYFIC